MKNCLILSLALASPLACVAADGWKAQLQKKFPRDPQLLLRYDLDGDKTLNVAELDKMYEFPPHNYKLFDADRDGTLGAQEKSQARKENFRLVRAALKKYDKNRDGKIDDNEIKFYPLTSSYDPFNFDQDAGLDAEEIAVLRGTIALYSQMTEEPGTPAPAIAAPTSPVVPAPATGIRYDLDNDGVVSASERQAALRFPNMAFQLFDRDHNERLDEAEKTLFLNHVVQLRKNWAGFDRNKNGRFDDDEIDFIVKRPGYAANFDSTGDGQLNADELAAMKALLRGE